MSARSLGHRAPLLWLIVPMMAGLSLARLSPAIPIILQLGAAALAALFAVVLAWRNGAGWFFAIATAMFFTGMRAYDLCRKRIAEWDLLPPREVRVSLRVERLFGQSDPHKSAGFGRVTTVHGPYRELIGQRVYFSAYERTGDPKPRRSAVIQCVGVLTPLPFDPPSNSFDGYLASSGINFRLNRSRCVGEERPPLTYYRLCDRAAEKFNVILGLGIADKRPALAGLLRAMMLGETKALTDEQHTLFMQSGTMHLFAISGLNIAVISGALQALLTLCRLRPSVRFAIGAPLLWLFVDITGGAPSAIRAFAMAMFFQAAFVVRRPVNPFSALVGSAFVVLLVQPLQLFSASFLMSYGIVASLLLLGLPLGEAWLALWIPWRDVPVAGRSSWQLGLDAAWRSLVPTIAIGVATALVGMLTGVEYFQLLTPGSLLANLVLIPAAMIVTVGGFAALICGLVGFVSGAVLCNHAAAVILWIIEWLVRQSVRMPWAFLPAQFKAPWIGNVALAMLLIAMLVGYGAAWQRKYGGYWPPFVIVALVLIFGVKFGS